MLNISIYYAVCTALYTKFFFIIAYLFVWKVFMFLLLSFLSADDPLMQQATAEVSV